MYYLTEKKNRCLYRKIKGNYRTFTVYPKRDGDEYTSALMQLVAKKGWAFPFYGHFESYPDDVAWILAVKDVDITRNFSEKKIIELSFKSIKRVDVPSYTVKIDSETTLKNVFEEFFM